MLRRFGICGMVFALSACAAGSSAADNQSAGGSTTAAISGTTGGASGGTTGGGSTGGNQGTSTGFVPTLGVTLTGDLAFPVGFAGEFYGVLPDGGPDLSNLDCRISNGTDLRETCNPPQPADPDAGLTATSLILDVYVTSLAPSPLSMGIADVAEPYSTDGGVFATVELTTCLDGGGWDFERALVGQVNYQATPSGIFGQFEALFPGYPDGGGTLSGTFGAGYCGSLNGY